MEFLKTLLGDNLLSKWRRKSLPTIQRKKTKASISELDNLGESGYVSKDKYTAFETKKGSV